MTEAQTHDVTQLLIDWGNGDKSALAKAKSFLDSNDNTVRVAAINAVLGIAENKPPVANLSAFEAVELAKKLK